MTTTNPFPSAAPDFSDPLGLLRACHENIFSYCTMLERLAGHLAERGLDQEATTAAVKIHRYFSTSAQQHHADEEEDLFPRIGLKAQPLAELIATLELEHRHLDTLWQELEPLLREPASIDDTEAFDALARQFSDANRTHALKENNTLLAEAEQLLDSGELRHIGRAMAARRGVSLAEAI